MILLGYAFTVVMGATLALLGGGGSILTVPILVYFFNVEASLASAYSLFVVGIASILAAMDYNRRDLIDFRKGITFALPALSGVFVARRFVVPALPEEFLFFNQLNLSKDNLILVVFSIVMLLASFSMILGRKIPAKKTHESINYPLISIEGFLIGSLTGFVGAGGGFIIIPALIVLFDMDMKIAVGTSLFVIAISSSLGFVGDLQSPEQIIHWPFLAGFTLVALIGIAVGTRLSRKIESKNLKPAFGIVVLIIGISMIVHELLSFGVR